LATRPCSDSGTRAQPASNVNPASQAATLQMETSLMRMSHLTFITRRNALGDALS
jgi:hypothetical protein